MLSIRKLFGQDETFYDLLEASADQAVTSIRLFARYLAAAQAAGQPPTTLDEFIQSRRKDKRITEQISEELARSFFTPIEREDIEALSFALYRIPKTVEKIVERLSIFTVPIPHEGLQRQAELLAQAADAVVFMVKQLRKGTTIEGIRDASDRLHYAEGEADKVMLALTRQLYRGPHEAKEFLMLQQLFEMVEKVVDRCRDAGNVVVQIVLKYS